MDVYFLSQRNEEAIKNKYYDKKTYKYDPSSGTYHTETKRVYLTNDENPNLGLDGHGNIIIDEDNQFPVLMGGWKWQKDVDTEVVANAITIIFE